jgi:hypothetical protein
MNQTEIGLQAALARLITTPDVALALVANRDIGASGLALSPADQAAMLQFLEQHGHQFKISVQLLKKRRWDGIRETYAVINRLYGEYELSCFWDDYLSELRLDDRIEQNPLKESIRFGEYLEAHAVLSDAHRELVRYEVHRNATIVHYASDPQSHAGGRIPHDQLALSSDESVELFIHPCLRIVKFTVNVAELVKQFAAGRERNDVLAMARPGSESCLFFKNWDKGGVGVIKASPGVVGFVEWVRQGRTLAQVRRAAMAAEIPVGAHQVDALVGQLAKAGMLLFRPADQFRNAHA